MVDLKIRFKAGKASAGIVVEGWEARLWMASI